MSAAIAAGVVDPRASKATSPTLMCVVSAIARMNARSWDGKGMDTGTGRVNSRSRTDVALGAAFLESWKVANFLRSTQRRNDFFFRSASDKLGLVK